MAKRPGPDPFYGQPTVRVSSALVPELYERLQREVLARAVACGDPERWTLSRLIHEDLARLYGIPLAVPTGAPDSAS